MRHVARLTVAAAMGGAALLAHPVLQPLGISAGLAQAQVVALQDLTFGQPDKISLRIPRLEIEGGNKTEAELRAILAPASLAEARAAIESLSAKSVKAPEIIIEATSPEGSFKMVYKNVVLDGIEKGVVTRATIPSQTIDAKPKSGPGLVGNAGNTIVEVIDIGAYLAVFDKAPAGNAAPRTLMGSATVDGMSFTDGANFSYRMGKATAGRITVKPSPAGMGDVVALFGTDPNKIPPEEMLRRLMPVLDVAESLDIGTAEYRDLVIEGTAPELKGGKVRIAVERTTATGNILAQKASAKLANITVVVPDGRISRAGFEAEGQSYAPLMKAARRIAAGAKLDSLDPREFVPDLGRWSIRDLKASLPDPENKASRVDFSLAGFTLDIGPQRNGIPTSLRVALESFSLVLPRDNPEVKPLLDLGLTKLDLGMEIDAAWLENSGTVEVKTVSFTGADLGTVTLTGKLGGLPASIFTAKPDDAMVMLMGATAKELTVAYEDDGLIDKFVAQQAKEQKTTAKQVREMMAGMAAVIVPEPLASTDPGQELVDALAGMVREPGTLTVTVTAKNAKGIPVMQLAGADDPAKLIDQVDISVEAE